MKCKNCGKEIDSNFKFCVYCGSKVTEDDTTSTNVNEVQTKTCPYCGTELPLNYNFCTNCGKNIESNRLTEAANTIDKKTSNNNSFTATQEVHRIISLLGNVFSDPNTTYFELDETHQLINVPTYEMPGFSTKWKKTDNLYNIKDIVDFELLDDGTSIANGASLTRAIVGGMAFGGIGAILGAGSRRKKCRSLSIKLVINDLDNPNAYINFITSAVNTNSKEYKSIYTAAQECLSILAIVLKENQNISSNQPIQKESYSPVDEIKKYKELLDMGAITPEEYECKKKQLLGL